MKKKLKISLILSLAIIFGCFSNIFAATNQNNRIKKIAEVKKSAKLLDVTNDNGVDQYTKLLLHMDDNGFKDELGHTVTNTGVTLDTTNKKFGEGSASFNGTNNYLNTPLDKNLDLSSGDFTIDWWQYQTSKEEYNIPFALGSVSLAYKTQMYFECGTAGTDFLCGNPASNSWAVNIHSKVETSLNVWQHIAIVRHGNTFTLYIDGVNCNSANYSGDLITTDDSLQIGRFNTGYGDYFHGYIDEFRISKGIARWVPIDNIELNKTTDSLILNDSIKGTDTLTAKITPDNAINKTVKWTSSNPDIVRVDDNGNIIAIKAGVATITATTTDGSNLRASCIVTVTDNNRCTLTINMVNGSSKQYDLSASELNNFLNWYNGMANPVSAQCYVFNNPITGPYLNNKDYIPFNKIDDFKVQEYTTK